MLPSNPTPPSPKYSSSGTVKICPHSEHAQESISAFVCEDICDDWGGSLGVISKSETDAEDGVDMLECEEEEVRLEAFLVRKASKPFLDFNGGGFVGRSLPKGRSWTEVDVDEKESSDGDRVRFEVLFNFDITWAVVEDEGLRALSAAVFGLALLKKPSIPCCPSSSFSRPVKERPIYGRQSVINFFIEVRRDIQR